MLIETAIARICRHCHRWDSQHVDGQCLFMPTHFQSMPRLRTRKETKLALQAVCSHKYDHGGGTFVRFRFKRGALYGRECLVCHKAQTDTGRLSSSQPNLQMYTKKDVDGVKRLYDEVRQLYAEF